MRQRYIELNPDRAGIVETPNDYSWSSYQANGQGKPIKMWTPHQVYQALGKPLSPLKLIGLFLSGRLRAICLLR
ncbi:hypothetical protein SAMN05216175_11915 [Neptunomonas qingdaonensis]|uniref:Transposase n=1 Tax=Neptunomonas qingdaonensis TaxID=1045558 RepID=A0A1I2VUA3_9GAMM|nr:hypothetical protein SAMN05216175_11915 [Neptunomonas qingdaonensis]